jgi:tetratricopeptide (TPR) repeat protein
MNNKLILTLAIIAIFFGACTAPKQIIHYDQLAINSADSGNYSQAITEWNTYINQQKQNALEINPKAYAELGKNYFALEQYTDAEINFDKARDANYADAEMYVMMSQRYKMKDNLSKEITALEYYRDHFSNDKDSSIMRNRLFETSLESENWEQAESIWAQMDESSKKNEKYLLIYFKMNKNLNHKEKCDEIALQLLSINNKNTEALDWMAKKYYKLAEDRYQNAMAVYNKRKTTKNYKILLKELDQVTIDFKKSLEYFEPLWDMEGGKKYAVYLANIYARFDDKTKSQYYKKYIK